MKGPLVDLVAEFLTLSSKEVRRIAAKAPTAYRSYKIPKRRGGYRWIFHPSKETKAIQYALMATYLQRLPVHPAAAAYRRQRSPLRRNAQRHAKFAYSVRLDLADFFPSITPEVLFRSIDHVEDDQLNGKQDGDRLFLRQTLFVKVGSRGYGLAVGAPSSPMVSNHVMFRSDTSLDHLAIGLGGVYSRYADDMVFSTNERGGCQSFAERVEAVIQDDIGSGMVLNKTKTLYMSKGTRRTVTGLFVCPDGTVSLGRARKRYIKKLVHEFRNGTLDEEEARSLRGYLAFVLDSEPEFYDRLCLKYRADTVKLALDGQSRK
jgi:RNA-directed DNA polymerase